MRFLVASMYARFSNQGRFNLFLERCSHLKKFCEKHRIERPLIFGDFASGHDTLVKEPGHLFGVSLIKVCQEKCFLVNFPEKHTFVNRCFNGGSVLDSCLSDFTVSINLSGFFVANDFKISTGDRKGGKRPICFSLHVSTPKNFIQLVLIYSYAVWSSISSLC